MAITPRIPPAPALRACTLAAALAIGSAACALLPERGGFEDVRKMSHDLAGVDAQWSQGPADAERLRSVIRQKLQGELSEDAAVEVAVLNNRKLQAIYQALGVAQADLAEASLPPNPVVDGSYKATINGGAGPEVEAMAVEAIVDLLTIPLKRRIAAAEFESAKLQVAQEIVGLAAETRGQYFIAQADEQAVEMLKQVVLAMNASADAARRLHEAGNLRDVERDNEELALAQAKMDLAAAQIDERKSRERLNILMGLWGEDAAIKLPTRLPEIPEREIDEEGIEARVIEKNFDLAILRQKIVALARKLGLAEATALFPEAGLGAAFKREADGNRLLGPQLSLPIPLFNQGRARIASAKAQLRHVQEEFYYKGVETRAAARAASDHLQLARARALYARDTILPLQHRVLEETQLEYNAMQKGVFQLLQAKRSEVEAGKRYIETMRDYWLARAEMESLLSGHVTAVGFETTALDSLVGSALH